MDTQAIRTKLKLTPLPIRFWFASEDVSLLVQAINQHFNIPDKDTGVLPILLARLEAKDIAADYFAGELSIELNSDRDKALGISAEVKRTILDPIKKDFSDFGIDISLLDKFQIPAIEGLKPSTPSGNSPKIIQDIGSLSSSIVPPPSTPKPTPIATATATSQTIDGVATLKSTAIPNSNIVPTASSKTNRLSDIGWSRSRTADPVVKLDITQPPTSAPAPKPMATPSAATPMQKQPQNISQQPAAPAKPTLSEFDRLNAMKKVLTTPMATPPAIAPAPTPAVPTAPAEPAPFILHQDTSFTASTQNAAFKISTPQANADMHLSSFKPQSTVKPAVLELLANLRNRQHQHCLLLKPLCIIRNSSLHFQKFLPKALGRGR
jgi:hypothetical protein